MRVVVDIEAYRRNLIALSERLAPAELMAVVKDDAYGHGLSAVVPTALQAGISRFAVLDIETGLRVRSLGAATDVQLFAWLFSPSVDFGPAIEANIDLGVSSMAILEKIASAARGQVARVHLKIDSGLHRNGASQTLWPDLVARARSLEQSGRIHVVGVWTHIGEASDEDDNDSQRIFEEACVVARAAGLQFTDMHLAASAASSARPEFRYTYCRVGGFTYGVAPGDGLGPKEVAIEPVMRAESFVCDVSECDGAGTVRIDGGFLNGIPDWVLIDGNIGTLPQPGFDVRLCDVRAPILEVAANYLVVDVSASRIPVSLGDEAILFGSHLRDEPVLQQWQDAIGTVGEEIVVRVGARNERFYC